MKLARFLGDLLDTEALLLNFGRGVAAASLGERGGAGRRGQAAGPSGDP